MNLTLVRKLAIGLGLSLVLCACSTGTSHAFPPPASTSLPASTAGGNPGNPSSSSVAPAATTTPDTPFPPTKATTAEPATTVIGSCDVAPQASPGATIGASFATALAFAPDGRLFFSERAGTVRVVQGGQAKMFATVSTVTTEQGGGYSERGLLGLAVDPAFRQNRFVYSFYSDANYTQQHVIRWTDCGGAGAQPKILLSFPAGDDCCHKGGRLAFGPDGKLYVTLGDEHAGNGTVAQNTSDVRGKILRYNPDGSVPADNPFGPANPVWVFGLRNPFGLAIAQSGRLAITSNGPSGEFPGIPATGFDTVIFAASRGAGFQCPNCFGYSHLNAAASSCGAGLLPPDWSSEGSTVVPTGATFVDAAGPSGFAGHLVFCTLKRGMLIFTPGTPQGTVAPGPATCQLDVKEGPDHALYYSGVDAIYRLG